MRGKIRPRRVCFASNINPSELLGMVLIFVEERFSKVLRWISPADAEINHAAARKLQQSGTGRWFTGGKTFRDWLESKDSFLWLYGIGMSLADMQTY